MATIERSTIPFPAQARIPRTINPEVDLTSELLYQSYTANRQYSPEIDPARWQLIYGPRAFEFEARLQAIVHDVFVKTSDYCNGGQSTISCGEPSVRCPGCGEVTSQCADHLWEQPNGMRVCVLCDGESQFRLGLRLGDRVCVRI
jgi:hypothetical protein